MQPACSSQTYNHTMHMPWQYAPVRTWGLAPGPHFLLPRLDKTVSVTTRNFSFRGVLLDVYLFKFKLSLYGHFWSFLAPEAVENFTAEVTSSRTVKLTWLPPSRPHGVLAEYHIEVFDVSRNLPSHQFNLPAVRVYKATLIWRDYNIVKKSLVYFIRFHLKCLEL